MNHILMQVLAEAESKGLTLLLDSVTAVVQQVLAGKGIDAAFSELGMELAERQAKALDAIVSPKP